MLLDSPNYSKALAAWERAVRAVERAHERERDLRAKLDSAFEGRVWRCVECGHERLIRDVEIIERRRWHSRVNEDAEEHVDFLIPCVACPTVMRSECGDFEGIEGRLILQSVKVRHVWDTSRVDRLEPVDRLMRLYDEDRRQLYAKRFAEAEIAAAKATLERHGVT